MLYIGILILAVLNGAGIWSLWKAFRSGQVEYGYKYYPSKFISNRKSDPGSFWLAVIVYSFSIIICILFIGFIFSH